MGHVSSAETSFASALQQEISLLGPGSDLDGVRFVLAGFQPGSRLARDLERGGLSHIFPELSSICESDDSKEEGENQASPTPAYLTVRSALVAIRGVKWLLADALPEMSLETIEETLHQCTKAVKQTEWEVIGSGGEEMAVLRCVRRADEYSLPGKFCLIPGGLSRFRFAWANEELLRWWSQMARQISSSVAYSQDKRRMRRVQHQCRGTAWISYSINHWVPRYVGSCPVRFELSPDLRAEVEACKTAMWKETQHRIYRILVQRLGHAHGCSDQGNCYTGTKRSALQPMKNCYLPTVCTAIGRSATVTYYQYRGMHRDML